MEMPDVATDFTKPSIIYEICNISDSELHLKVGWGLNETALNSNAIGELIILRLPSNR